MSDVSAAHAEASALGAVLTRSARMFATMSAPAVRKHPGAMATPSKRGDMPERTDISEADPCVVCGTTGGYVPPGSAVPRRVRRACQSCYGKYHHAGRLDDLPRPTCDAQAFLQRLLSGEVDSDDGGCILWPGWTGVAGHGKVDRNGTTVSVAQVVLEAFVGPPPTPDHEAAHAPHDVCGHTACVNVEHLRWATHAENLADKIIDGTGRGERNGYSKLTEQDVLEIRDLYASGKWIQREIGEIYGVSRQQVGTIVRGEQWTHLNE